MSFSSQKDQFNKDKSDLDPNFKPQTNIPSTIALVRNIKADRLKNPTGDEYAVFKMMIDVETDDGIATKVWNISSAKLVATLEEKGIDIGSSFTVLKTGEGFHTNYQISDVVNKKSEASAAPAV